MVQVVSVLLCVVIALPSAVRGCSCPLGTFDRSRAEAIKDDFCLDNTSVYIGTVLTATCNCVPLNTKDADFYCRSYSLQDTMSVQVNEETVGRAKCANKSDYVYEFLYNCSEIVERLVGGIV